MLDLGLIKKKYWNSNKNRSKKYDRFYYLFIIDIIYSMLLEFKEVKSLLKKYNLNFPDTELFTDKEKALEYAKKIGYPVTLKAYNTELLHRTEKGGVALNINNDEDFLSSFEKLKEIGDVLVQKHVGGYLISVGIKNDKQFGPVIMFGLGGIFIEVLKDVSFRLCPINKEEAMDMIKEIKGFEILNGARGGIKANLDKLQEFLVNTSKLAVREQGIQEADFNPVFVDEYSAVAADFKFLKK